MSYESKLYNEIYNIGGLCERISMIEFEDLIKNGLLDCLSPVESYVLRSRFNHENSLIYIAYEIGYASASSINNVIRRSLHKLIVKANSSIELNKEDPIKYIADEALIQKSGIFQVDYYTNIGLYMSMCDACSKNITKADVYIIMKILKAGLKIRPNMKAMADVANHDIMLLDAYNMLVNQCILNKIKNEMDSFDICSVESAFVRNFEKVLSTVYSNDQKKISIILSLIPYSTKVDVTHVSEKLFSVDFLKVVLEPKCLYTEVYFKNAESKDIRIDSLITLPDDLIKRLDDYSKGMHGTVTLHDLAEWLYNDSSKLVDIIRSENVPYIKEVINNIMEVNNKIASEFHDICKK